MSPAEKRAPVSERAVPTAEWRIQKRSRTCAACARPFSDGEKYRSVLRAGGELLQRSDYCRGCWTALGIEAPDIFSFWQGTFVKEEPLRKPEAIEPTRAEDLFARLVGSDEPSSLKLACVFALLLERKKKLVCRGRAERDGRAYVIYEHSGTGLAYMVKEMNIDLGEAESIQADLNKLLAAEGIGRANNRGSPSNCEDKTAEL